MIGYSPNNTILNRITTTLARIPYIPPSKIPGNVCSENYNVCCRRWFEDTLDMFKYQCNQLRSCPECAKDMIDPVTFEYNLVDCQYIDPDSE